MKKREGLKKNRLHGFLCVCIAVIIIVGCAKYGKEDVDMQSTGLHSQSTERYEDKNTEMEVNKQGTTTETDLQDTSNEEVENIEPLDTDMVLILDYIPDLVIDLKYATTDNFTGQIIYENADAYLRYGTVKKLMQVQKELKEKGYKIVLWDGYRPVAAQFKLWDICPDSNYVANPNKGFSKHSRGSTVDVTIVTVDGEMVEMPTGFDDFTKNADRDYSDVSKEAAQNSQMLEDIMTKAGFRGYQGEWWHYNDTTEYPVIE